jgi:hypothetical protein
MGADRVERAEMTEGAKREPVIPRRHPIFACSFHSVNQNTDVPSERQVPWRSSRPKPSVRLIVVARKKRGPSPITSRSLVRNSQTNLQTHRVSLFGGYSVCAVVDLSASYFHCSGPCLMAVFLTATTNGGTVLGRNRL